MGEVPLYRVSARGSKIGVRRKGCTRKGVYHRFIDCIYTCGSGFILEKGCVTGVCALYIHALIFLILLCLATLV